MHAWYEYIYKTCSCREIGITKIQYGVLTLVFATLLTLVLLQKKEKVENNTFAKQETFLQFSERRNRVFVRRNLEGQYISEKRHYFDREQHGIRCRRKYWNVLNFCANHVSPSKIKLFSFEPIPRIHEICKANLDMHVNANGGNATCLQLGVSDKVGVATFDFHHNFSLWSTAMPDFNERRKDRLLTDLGAMTESFKNTGRCKWFFKCVPNCLVSFIARRFLGVLNHGEKK